MSTVSLTAANDQPGAHSFVMSLVVRALRDIGVSRADIRLVVDGYRY
jgi:hypothetical protein